MINCFIECVYDMNYFVIFVFSSRVILCIIIIHSIIIIIIIKLQNYHKISIENRFFVFILLFYFYKMSHVTQAGFRLTMDHLELLIRLYSSPKYWN